MDYTGVIIEESLVSKDFLDKLLIVSTEIEDVTEDMQTPWLKQWTLHTVVVPEKDADLIAQQISQSLDSKRTNWYADYKNKSWHYIIFRNKVFKVNLSKPGEYVNVVEYGVNIGVPRHQLNF